MEIKGIAVAIGLAAALTLAACGGNGDQIPTPTATTSAATPTPTSMPEATPTFTPAPEPTPTPPTTQLPGDPETGRALYTSANPITCNTCHSLDGSVGLGPSFQGISERAGERVPGLSAEEYLRQSILDPPAYVVEGFSPVMPTNFGDTLSEEDINNLVAFLLTQ